MPKSLNAPRSAVYQILNLRNGKRYVGSAVDFKARWAKHISDLRRGRNNCKKLQNTWNKWGGEWFLFMVVEFVPNKKDLLQREQFYLDCMKPEYNICKVAGSPLGLKDSAETRLKKAAANSARTDFAFRRSGSDHPSFGKARSADFKSLMSDKHRGRGNPMFGVTPPQAKLCAEEVRQIRCMLENGVRSQVLADTYGVSKGAIQHIKKGRSYQGVV